MECVVCYENKNNLISSCACACSVKLCCKCYKQLTDCPTCRQSLEVEILVYKYVQVGDTKKTTKQVKFVNVDRLDNVADSGGVEHLIKSLNINDCNDDDVINIRYHGLEITKPTFKQHDSLLRRGVCLYNYYADGTYGEVSKQYNKA